jgi:regulatory protein
MTEREKQVYDALSAQCAKREYCVADIRRKALQRLSQDPSVAPGSALGPAPSSALGRGSSGTPGSALGRSAVASGSARAGAASSADAVVAALVADGFVDDRRYAAAFAREKSALSGWGPVKIRSALLARGVARDAVLEALEAVDPERAAAKLEKVLETKWRALRDDPQGRLKLIRFALSRGYDYDPIRPLVERITRPSEDD